MLRIKALILSVFCMLLCQACLSGVLAEDIASDPESWDIQYVIYLGTNDKDTNTPVFTQMEAIEQAKVILIRHFGGFTLRRLMAAGWTRARCTRNLLL